MQRSHWPQVSLKPLLAHSWHVLSANFGENTMNEQSQQKNNRCLDMGLLASLRDDELTADEAAQANAHLALCPDCTADERDVNAASQEVYSLFSVLAPSPNEIPEPGKAFAALQTRLHEQNRHDEHAEAAYSPANIQFISAKKPQHRTRWLNKSTRNTCRVGYLDALFPDCVVVHVVRNPVAVVESLLRVEWWPTLRAWPFDTGGSGLPAR